ncbi:NifB/NifX family molybdenum-iron cluster-binding protein [uncultured Methanofollis sp.]|uniref:NifB/NifX family molybdenum-iron cluster-binding protein n=1 Tax=uncultured Methanofollis sp. TaxID=262500 RepID=UPI00262A8292|nr:NifB/NifX family molybdenum-iron cluster-binding protein [uncultured Methanofollis sp.]
MPLIVCITADGPDAASQVQPRFGRAPYFVFADTEKGTIEAVKNPVANAQGGVGPRAVQAVLDHGATSPASEAPYQMAEHLSREMKIRG